MPSRRSDEEAWVTPQEPELCRPSRMAVQCRTILSQLRLEGDGVGAGLDLQEEFGDAGLVLAGEPFVDGALAPFFEFRHFHAGAAVQADGCQRRALHEEAVGVGLGVELLGPEFCAVLIAVEVFQWDDGAGPGEAVLEGVCT